MLNCCTIRNILLCCSLNHSLYQTNTHTQFHSAVDDDTTQWPTLHWDCAKHNSSGLTVKLSLGKHPCLYLLYFAPTYCTLWSDVDHKWVFNILHTFLSYWHTGLHIKPPSMGCPVWPNHCLKTTFFTNVQQNSM